MEHRSAMHALGARQKVHGFTLRKPQSDRLLEVPRSLAERGGRRCFAERFVSGLQYNCHIPTDTVREQSGRDAARDRKLSSDTMACSDGCGRAVRATVPLADSP